jgi:hypothetical protein
MLRRAGFSPALPPDLEGDRFLEVKPGGATVYEDSNTKEPYVMIQEMFDATRD